MRFLYSIQESATGWRVGQGGAVLADSLPLAKAIKYARKLGREHHERTGFAVTVELVIPEKALLLAQYASRPAEAAVAA